MVGAEAGQWVDTVVLGAASGFIAGLVVAAALGIAQEFREHVKRRQEERYLRSLFIEGKIILTTEDLQLEGLEITVPADHRRAAEYKILLRQVGVALERWSPHLSPSQRKDIYDALDWFHTDTTRMLFVTTAENEGRFVDVPDGTFPAEAMTAEAAAEVYERLQAIGWLKLKRERAIDES